MRRHSALAFLVVLASACTATGADAPKTAAATPPASAAARASKPIVPGGTLTGTVREVIPVESYLYLRLETSNGEVWAAVNQAKLDVGSAVTVYNVLPMEQFASPSLKRTFATIYFGSTEPVDPAPSADMTTASSAPGTPAAPDARVGVVAPATGSGANVIATVWREKNQLVRATVIVRGVVVKYNAGVMGKNWIHLQDGSGDPAKGTHDIAATTLDAAAIGDTITVMGVVRTNVDVGAGYKYALLLENSRVVGR